MSPSAAVTPSGRAGGIRLSTTTRPGRLLEVDNARVTDICTLGGRAAPKFERLDS
jgi:hypothetical protein